jgi:hypothetical protein
LKEKIFSLAKQNSGQQGLSESGNKLFKQQTLKDPNLKQTGQGAV